MKRGILKAFFPLLFALIVCLGLTACNSNSKSTTLENPNSMEQEVGENTKNQIDRHSEIIDRSKDEGKFIIYYLDLPSIGNSDDKSGDSSLLISPDGKVMLIDAGLSECAPRIINFLEELGIDKIDYFVASHPHIDHIGGFFSIADKFEIGKIYRNEVEYTTNTYKKFAKELEGMNIPVEYLKEGDEITFGDEIQVKIYNPPVEIVYPEGYPNNSTQFINDSSILMKFTYGESTVLFAGDIYMSKERDLIKAYGDELQADVVKANHHGADTSNSNRWIKNLHAKIVVAMNDKIDGMSVYNNFVKAGTTYYNTALNGYVKVVIDNQKNYTVVNQYDNWNNEASENATN